MSFEEILEAEYGKGKVIIDYSKKTIDNTIGIRIINKDKKKEFRAEGILSEGYIEIAGSKYTVFDFISALNDSFNRKSWACNHWAYGKLI